MNVAEAAVLLTHVAASDDGNNAWPAVATIAEKTKVSERTVQRAIKALTLLGELRVDPNAGRRGVNVYTVVMRRQDDTPTASHPDSESPRQNDGVSLVTSGGDNVSPRGDMGVTRTVLEPSKTHPSTTSSSDAARLDVERICTHLADRIEANGSKRPNITRKWRDAARLMLDADGRDEQRVHTAIDWCQDHEFWRTNILSLPKLREKYDQLRLAAQRPTAPTAGRRRNTDDKVRDGFELAQRLAAQDDNPPQIGA